MARGWLAVSRNPVRPEGEMMSVTGTDETREKIDALQERVADLKSSADQTRKETSERVRAHIDQAQADIAARQQAMREKAGQAAGQAQGQWQAMQADAAAKVQEWQDRINRNATRLTSRERKSTPR